jgi:hypothetical protein
MHCTAPLSYNIIWNVYPGPVSLFLDLSDFFFFVPKFSAQTEHALIFLIVCVQSFLICPSVFFFEAGLTWWITLYEPVFFVVQPHVGWDLFCVFDQSCEHISATFALCCHLLSSLELCI